MKRVISTALAIGLAGAGLFATQALANVSGIRLNASPSMPLGIYRFRTGAFPTQHGQDIFFCPNGTALTYMQTWHPDEVRSGSCPGGAMPFVKIVAALPGDRVDLEKDGIHVNGAPALPGTAPLRRASDENGVHALPSVNYGSRIVAPHTVWAYTPEWYSFDSRYYGAITPIGVAEPHGVISIPVVSTMPRSVAELQK